MTTEIIITGTGCPRVLGDQAGPGLLVRRGNTTLQFDAGRATTMRLAQAGVDPEHLTCLFVTHHHSDHLLGVADLVHTRWIHTRRGWSREDNALPVVVPSGPATDLIGKLLDPWDDDIKVRNLHMGTNTRPRFDVSSYEPQSTPHVVWSDGTIEVDAFLVEHPPVVPSVGYKVRTPEGAIVISGDTLVCDAVFDAADGADLVVHEVILDDFARGSPVGEYHANAIDLGKQAEARGVSRLVLTHYVPTPPERDAVKAFADETRAGGFTGDLHAAWDLDRFEIG